MRTVWRIRLLTIGCVVVTALSIGVITLYGFRGLIVEQQEESVESQVLSEAKRLRLALNELSNDVKLLATLPIIEEISAATHGSDQDPNNPKKQLSQVFREMLRAKPHYSQIRLIGAAQNGREIVRVDRRGDDVLTIAESELQNKGGRDYFTETIKLPAGELYLSPINLNREHGAVEVPHHPMLRAGIRVDTKSESPFGIVIINLDFNKFIQDLLVGAGDQHTYYLANESGDYLVHPDKSKTFGFDLGNRHQVQDDFPVLSSLFTNGGQDKTTHTYEQESKNESIVNFRKIDIFPGNSKRFLALGIAASSDKLAAGATTISNRSLAATALLIGLTVIAGFIMSQVQTRPIETIAEAARNLAKGKDLPDLPTTRDDELGDLARTFKEMAITIRNKESEILKANSQLAATNDDLEHFVHIAAHDLREPLRKQRNLVDLLLMKSDSEKEVENETQTYLGYISTCSRQMQDMVDAFRALTKLGYTNLAREDTPLRPLIEDCLADFSSELETRNVGIHFDPFPETVKIYPHLVKRLYGNLIQNALKHVRQNTFDLFFTAENTEDGWIFGVRNTGSTIPTEKSEAIFQLFRTAGNSKNQGSGVGLAICKKIMERHRGVLFVESSENDVHFLFRFGEYGNGKDR